MATRFHPGVVARLLQLLIVVLGLSLPALSGSAVSEGGTLAASAVPAVEASAEAAARAASVAQGALVVLSLALMGFVVHLAVATRQR